MEREIRQGDRLHVWPVIAGVLVALATGFFVMSLGNAIGITAARPRPQLLTGLSVGYICWGLATMFTSGLLGAWVTALFAGTSNIREGVLHGVIVWAALVIASASVVGSQMWGASLAFDIQRSRGLSGAPRLGTVIGAWGVVLSTGLALVGAALGGMLGARREARQARTAHREAEQRTEIVTPPPLPVT